MVGATGPQVKKKNRQKKKSLDSGWGARLQSAPRAALRGVPGQRGRNNDNKEKTKTGPARGQFKTGDKTMALTFEMTGKVKQVGEIQTFQSGFEKRELVVIDDDPRFPQDIAFNFVRDRTHILDSIAVGDFVKVTFDIRGREYNGRHYTDLTGWRVEKVQESAPGGYPPPPAPAAPGAYAPPRQASAAPAPSAPAAPASNEDLDDLPF